MITQIEFGTTDRTCDFKDLAPRNQLTTQQQDFIQDTYNFTPHGWLVPNQVHGDYIYLAHEGQFEWESENVCSADAVISNVKGLAIGIRTADCLPVFLSDAEMNILALIHAGWRGTQKNITAKTVERMIDVFKCNPKNIKAVLGPCIQRASYVVGSEFNKLFSNGIFNIGRQWHLDLPLVNRNQLLKLGISDNNISVSDVCTFEDAGCFSYRREGELSGRMLSFMYIKDE